MKSVFSRPLYRATTFIESYPYLSAWISYLLIACIFLYPIFLGKILIVMDNLLHIAPMYALWKSEILSGRIPLWNPYLFAGVPYIGDPSHPIFNPGNLFFLAINNLNYAVDTQILLVISLISLGVYFLSRTISIKPYVAWLCGLSVGLSGSVFTDVNDLNSLYGFLYLPWIIAFYLRFLNKRNLSSKFQLALSLTLLMISGHTQYLYYAFLALFIFFVYHLFSQKPTLLVNNFKSLFLDHLLIGSLFLSWSAIVLIPNLEYLFWVHRSSALHGQQIHSEKLITAIRFILPTFFGKLSEGNSWGPGSQLEYGLAGTHGFVNLIFIFGALVAAKKILHHKYVKPLLLISLFSFFFSFGNSLPIYQLAGRIIPGWSMFRSPTRILSLYTISLVLLGGLTIDQYLLQKRRYRISLRLDLVAIAIAVIVFSLLIFKPTILSTVFISLYQFIKHQSILEAPSYNLLKINAISHLLLRAVFFMCLGITTIISLYSYRPKHRQLFLLIIPILLIFESFVNVRGNLIFAPENITHLNPSLINFLQTHLGNQRYISTTDTQPYTGIWNYYAHLFVRPPFSTERVTSKELTNWHFLSTEMSMIPSDLNMTVSLKSASGYVALLPQAYQQFTGSTDMNRLNLLDYTHPAINDFSVKYIVTGVPEDMLSSSPSAQFTPVYNQDGIQIYQNQAAEPRAQFMSASDTSHPIDSVTDPNPQTVVINLNATQSGTLILRDFYYPGWTVTIDSVSRNITPYQHLFRSLLINPGDQIVKFTYKPASFLLGTTITLISSFGSLGYLWVVFSRRNHIRHQ